MHGDICEIESVFLLFASGEAMVWVPVTHPTRTNARTVIASATGVMRHPVYRMSDDFSGAARARAQG
jgi:hypothetical protein